MKKLFILLLATAAFVPVCASAAAKHPLSLTGMVKAKSTNISLMDADVELVSPEGTDTIRAKARSITSVGTRAARSYKEVPGFYLTVPDVESGHYELIISYAGYEPAHMFLDFSDLGRREYNRDIGTVYLERERPVQTLNEVTVTTSKVKFYNKGDTIVYNADAFNLAEGSMLDELIKQFPGVELKEGGKIYVNGRFVESLLLNGKDFFKGENLVLLENLGAYTVKDVQVYEKISDESRFAGRQVNANEYVMDVNLKKEYIGGWTFNTEAGYGTENRYLGRFFGLNFDAKRRFSLYANINNLNDKRVPGESNSWTPATNPNGLLRHIESGFDYNIETTDDGRNFVSGNARFNQDRTNLQTVTDNVSFYPSGNMSSRSVSGNVNRDMTLKTSHKLQIEKNYFMGYIEPTLSYRHRRSRSQSSALNLNVELPADEVSAEMDKAFDSGLGSVDRSQVINATFDEAFSKSNTFDFSTIASSSIKIPKTSDYMNIFLQYNHRNDSYDTGNDYMIGYGDPSIAPLIRRQHTNNSPNHGNSVIAEISYNYKINDNWSATLVADQRYDHNSKESSFYMAQAEADASGDFTLGHLATLQESYDPSNSYHSVETSQRLQINPVLRFNTKKIDARIDLPLAHMSRKLDYNRGGVLYPVKDSRWILRKATALLRWYESVDNRYLYMRLEYVANHDLPTLTRMIDIDDTTNPLATYLGNSVLSTSLTHTLTAEYTNSYRNKYSVSGKVSLNFTSDEFIQSRLYDTSTGYTVYQWLNSPMGTYSLNEQLFGNLTVGRYKNIDLNVSFNSVQSKTAMMTGENASEPTLHSIHNYSYNPQLNILYSFGKNRVGATGSVTFRHSTSTRPESNDINAQDFKYGVQGIFKLPANFGISTDFFVYQRRGYDSPQLNTSDLIWNMRLQKTLCKGSWLLAVDGFDLLQQLTNVRYSVSSTGRTESYSNTLPRYVLFHVQYKINIKPKKKELTNKTYNF